MTNTDAGDNASSARTPMSASKYSSNLPISPAARKFAEYLARHMRPMIESAAKQQHCPTTTQTGQDNQ
jgi:hypothetical protein